jgi:sortase A
MRNKRLQSRFLIALGLLLIGAAFLLTAYNFYENYRAGKEAQEIAKQLQKEEKDTDWADNQNKDREMSIVMLKGKKYIGILEIPSLDLVLPIMSDWSYPNLRLAPCRYSGSAYQSNLVIAAHNYLTHFGRLKELNIGDSVIFEDMDGNRFEYEVSETEILQPTDVEEMKAEGNDLTLFTCTIGGKTRYTVRCKLQEAEDYL